jgi:hypothetical protein
MSGSQQFGRERRESIASPVAQPGAQNIPEVSGRGAMWAIREANEGIPQVMDVAARIANREAQAISTEVGRAQGESEQLQRDENGRLVVPDLSRGLLPTAGSEARREALLSRYASELISDTQGQVAQLRRDAGDDPDRFREAFTNYRNGLLSTIPEGVRGVFAPRLLQLGDQHFNNLMEQRIRREREEASVRAVDVVNRSAQDAHDLILAGADATPAREQARTLLRANQGVIPPAQYVALERQIEVVGPVQAQLMRDVRRAPAGQGATIQALMGGPGTAGWRPEWASLTQDERRGLAQMVSSMQGAARSDISWGQAQGDRAERDRFARLALRDANIDAELAALPPGDDRRAALMEERSRVRTEVVQNAPRYAATFVRQQTAEDQRRTAQEGAQAVAAMRITRAMEQMEWNVSDPDVRAIINLPQSVPATVRAELLEAEARRQTQEAGEARRRQAAEGPFQQAMVAALAPQMLPPMAPMTQAPNNADNQARLMSLYQQGGAQSLSEVPPRTQARFAAQGIVPDRLGAEMENALRGRDEGAVRRMAAIHEAMTQDPRALARYRETVGQRVYQAYSGLAEMLATQPPRPAPTADNPNPPQNLLLQTAFENATRVMRGDPTLEQEVRASMGGERAAQDRTIAEVRTEAMRRAGITTMPVTAQETFNGALFSHLAIAPGDPQAAAHRAMAETMRVYRPSSMGFEGVAPDRGGFFSGPGARLMRNPPEQFTVPEGRAGAASTDWIGRLVRERVSEAEGRRDRPGQGSNPFSPQLGVNTFLRLAPETSPTGAPLYEIWRTMPDASGRPVPQPVPMIVSGRATGATMTVDLAAEAETRTARWRERYVPRAEADRDAADGQAAPALGVFGFPLNILRAGPPPEPRR